MNECVAILQYSYSSCYGMIQWITASYLHSYVHVAHNQPINYRSYSYILIIKYNNAIPI